MEIRDAEQTDLTGIFRILNREIRTGINTFKIDEVLEDSQQTWWQSHVDGNYPILVAIENAEIAGWASLSAYSSINRGYALTAEVSVWISPEYQGRGIGNALYGQLIPRAAASGFRALVARIEASNEASIQLHRKYEFSMVGIMRGVGWKNDRALDVAIMQRLLVTSTSENAQRSP